MLELQAATAIDPNHFDSLRLLAYCEMDQTSYATALAHLDKALNLRPDDISALRLQAICRIQTGQRAALGEELARLGEILEESPSSRKFEMNDLLESDAADDQRNQDVFDLKTVERLAELIPGDVEVLDLLMHNYAKAGKLFEAITTIEKIEKLRPNQLEDKINHAILCFSGGQMEVSYRLSEEIVNDDRLKDFIQKHKNPLRFFTGVITSIETHDPIRSKAICSKLIGTCEKAQTKFGEYHFLYARLLLTTEHETGIPEALNQLILAGQQNRGFLSKWYLIDPVFKKYHPYLSKNLSQIFPEIDSTRTITK